MTQSIILSVIALFLIYFCIGYSLLILADVMRMLRRTIKRVPVYIRQALF